VSFGGGLIYITGRKEAGNPDCHHGGYVIVDGYLYAEKDGKAGLATCSPDGLEMKGTFSVLGTNQSRAHPVVFGGRLYLRYDDNPYCFNVKAK